MKHSLSSTKYFGVIITLLFSAVLSTQATAEDFMSEEAVKALVVGNTIHATHLKKDFEFKVYFSDDGKTAIREQGGDSAETTYEFKGDKHCIFWKEKNRCANILDNGDGTYTRVNKKGKKIVKWTKIIKGKHL